MRTIPVKIGWRPPAEDDCEVIYHAMDTNAPVDYDGFGTFCVVEFDGTRTVMIRDEHFQWQTIRYQSGNHWVKPTDHDVKDIETELWKRLMGTSKHVCG